MLEENNIQFIVDVKVNGEVITTDIITLAVPLEILHKGNYVVLSENVIMGIKIVSYDTIHSAIFCNGEIVCNNYEVLAEANKLIITYKSRSGDERYN
jgi:hypothetical protein